MEIEAHEQLTREQISGLELRAHATRHHILPAILNGTGLPPGELEQFGVDLDQHGMHGCDRAAQECQGSTAAQDEDEPGTARPPTTRTSRPTAMHAASRARRASSCGLAATTRWQEVLAF